MSAGPFQAEVRRELRDRRAGILVLAASVPVLVALAWPLFGGAPPHDLREALPGIAVLLAALVVGLDLFSRDVRGGEWALVLRTPGAFRRVFAARLVLFFSAALLAFALEEGSRLALESATGLGAERMAKVTTWMGDPQVRTIIEEPQFFGGPLSPPRNGALVAIALAFGVWFAVGSAWSRAGAAVSLLGALALVAAAAPFAILHAIYPYAFLTRRSEVVVGAVLLACLGLAVLVIAYVFGRRRLAGSRRAVLAGLTLTALASGTGAALAHADVLRWLDFDLAQPGVHLGAPLAFVGEGGRYLFVTVHRGREYTPAFGLSGDHPSPGEPASEGPGTPPRPYAIDLVDGTARPIGEFGEYVFLPPGAGSVKAFVPVPWVVTQSGEGDALRMRWIDARTATERLLVGTKRQPQETAPWAREVARAMAVQRDSQGRRVWVLDGRLEREGEPTTAERRPNEAPWAYAAPGGWILFGAGEKRFLNLETGASSPWKDDRPDGRVPSQGIALGSARALVRGVADDLERRAGDEAWTLLDLDAATERPTGLGGKDEVLTTLGDGRVVVRTGGDSSETPPSTARLSIWDSRTEARSPIRCDDAAWLACAHVPERALPLPDGRFLTGWQDSWRSKFTQSWAILDPAARTIHPLTPCLSTRIDAVALLPGDALISIEDEHRVVRYGPTADERVVRWPKSTVNR